MKTARVLTVLVLVFLILPADSAYADWAQQAKLLASDGAVYNYFGYSVSVSGDYAIVGAYYDDDKGANSGSAYIFKRDGTSWSQQAKLLAADGAAGDVFGYSVSISGDYAIVGAYYDEDNGFQSGSAYIFKRSGTSWSQQAKLLASDGAVSDFFGHSVSISGDYAIVGAYLDDDNGGSSGSGYIFKRDGTSWSQQAKLLAADGNYGDYFGFSVSISGDYVVVGAFWDDDNGSDSGSAYIFKRDGTSWSQQTKLLAADGAPYDYFGRSVSISGAYAVVGALHDDDNGGQSGSAYIFERSGSSWSQQVKLLASDGAAGDRFGSSVSISGAYAVVGAYEDDDNGSNSGSAYIFYYDGSSWSQQTKLLAADGAAEDEFGRSVAIDGYYAIVGAHYDDDNGTDSGSAYVFIRTCELTVSSDSNGIVTTPGEGLFYYGYGTVVSIVAEPNLHYQFWEWTGTAVDAGKVADPCAASTTVTMHGNYTIVANFVPQKTLTISSDSNGSVTTPGEGIFYYDYGEAATIIASANVGHHFTEWTGTAVDAGKVADPCAASTTVTMDGNYTVMANFAIDVHTLTVSSTTGGSVNEPGEDVFKYNYGTVVPILAEAEPNFHFVQWTGSAVSAAKVAEPEEPNTTVTMHGNYTLMANFVRTIIYVDANAIGANDGSSWTNAYNLLQDGLSAAGYGSTILMADGNYTPDQGGGQTAGDRNATFDLVNGVAMYGGYAGVSSPDPDARDIDAYETILSGDLNDNDEPNFVNNGENSYQVVTASSTDSNTVLDGFTITAGNADGGPIGKYGAGIYNDSGSLLLSNCILRENTAHWGAGMYNYNSSPTVTKCTFSANAADKEGGGMYNSSTSNPTLTNCTFSRNSAAIDGGGIYNDWSNAILTNCILTGNTAADNGGGMYFTSPGSAMVTNCTFRGNSAYWNGGGIHNDGGVTLFNCILWGNTDRHGTDEEAQIHDRGTIFIEYSCVQGWTGGFGGTGNIGDDPNFVDPNGPDNIVGTEDDNLRLSPDSNCIDAGDNNSVPVDVTTDLDGHHRFIDGDCNDTDIVDMGAYEFNYAYLGDFDYNCWVNFGDFAIFALAWLTEPPDANWNQFCDISIPAGNKIDWADVEVLSDNWLSGP